jgi:hypothetical protein
VLGPSVENNLSVLIKKRRYSAALHNVAVIHAAKLAAFRKNFPARSLKQKRLWSFTFRSRWCSCAKLSRPWRWRFFRLSLVSTFRLPVTLAVIA